MHMGVVKLVKTIMLCCHHCAKCSITPSFYSAAWNVRSSSHEPVHERCYVTSTFIVARLLKVLRKMENKFYILNFLSTSKCA